jgi:hypothetical protein
MPYINRRNRRNRRLGGISYSNGRQDRRTEGRDRFPPPDKWWIEPVYRDTSRVPLTLQEKIDRAIYAKIRRWVYEQHLARVERNAARARAAAETEARARSLQEPTFSLEEIEDAMRSPARSPSLPEPTLSLDALDDLEDAARSPDRPQSFNEEEVAEMIVEMKDEELDNLMAGMTQEEYADFIAKMKEGDRRTRLGH